MNKEMICEVIDAHDGHFITGAGLRVVGNDYFCCVLGAMAIEFLNEKDRKKVDMCLYGPNSGISPEERDDAIELRRRFQGHYNMTPKEASDLMYLNDTQRTWGDGDVNSKIVRALRNYLNCKKGASNVSSSD